MKLTEADLSGIPAANIRVPRDEFVALWTAAEEADERLTAAKVVHWDVGGVLLTCRWLAGATYRLRSGRRCMSTSPVTDRQKLAMPELITAEFHAGETLLMRANPPAHVVGRREMYEAAVATLRWAWMRSGPAPYHWVSQAGASRTDLAHQS